MIPILRSTLSLEIDGEMAETVMVSARGIEPLSIIKRIKLVLPAMTERKYPYD